MVEQGKRYWAVAVCFILCVKSICYLLDPSPMFFMRDSMSFIETAVTGFVEPIRSFAYGYLIRYLAVSWHTLDLLIAVQVALSAFSAIILVHILVRFFHLSLTIAFMMGILCAIEPLQLLYERYVMAETIALFLFACYLWLSLSYIERRALWLLVVVQLAGCALIAFRLSFLPIVQLNVVLLPVVACILYFKEKKAVFKRKRGVIALTAAIPFFVSILSFQVSHSWYKQLTGRMTGLPPAYSSVTGYLFLAFWSPLLTVEDFPRKDLGLLILSKTAYPLASRHDRAAQWARGDGLINGLRKEIGDEGESYRFAKETAFNILKRDPIGVVLLYLKTYTDYWHTDYLKALLPLDRGEDPLPVKFLVLLKGAFHLDAEKFPQMITLTNSYFYKAWPWYLMVLCAPFFAIFSMLAAESLEQFAGRVVVFIFTLLITISACHLAVVRYLQPLAWVIFVSLGPLLDMGWKRFFRSVPHIAGNNNFVSIN